MAQGRRDRNPELEYLSDGITESLINSLSQIPTLRVVPRSSVFRYKGQDVDARKVGRQLKVRALLTGKVLQRGDTLNVQAELVDVKQEAQLWGERFVRKVADIFAVEDEIAQQIAGKLRLKLTGEERTRLARRYTEDTEAYHLYLKGRYFWSKRTGDDLKKGLAYFEQAIARDSGYALAYAGLADAYLVMSFFDAGLPTDLLSKGKAAALRALEIDPDLPETHATLGFIEACLDHDWAAAEHRYRHAIERKIAYGLTHDHYAMVLGAQGRFDEAVAQIRRSQELEPLSPIVYHHAASASRWTHMRLTAGEKLGPYEIVAQIGKGGMGEVYSARDTRLGRDAAINVSVDREPSCSPTRRRMRRPLITICVNVRAGIYGSTRASTCRSIWPALMSGFYCTITSAVSCRV